MMAVRMRRDSSLDVVHMRATMMDVRDMGMTMPVRMDGLGMDMVARMTIPEIEEPRQREGADGA